MLSKSSVPQHGAIILNPFLCIFYFLKKKLCIFLKILKKLLENLSKYFDILGDKIPKKYILITA